MVVSYNSRVDQGAIRYLAKSPAGNPFMTKSRFLAFLIKEFREFLPPTVFFAVGFSLVVLTTDLILADYLMRFASLIAATMGALMVGKSVLIGNAMPFFRVLTWSWRAHKDFLHQAFVGD